LGNDGTAGGRGDIMLASSHSDRRDLGFLRGYFPSPARLPLVVFEVLQAVVAVAAAAVAVLGTADALGQELIITWQDSNGIGSISLGADGSLTVPQNYSVYPSALHVLSAIEGYAYATDNMTPYAQQGVLNCVSLPVSVGYWGGSVYGYYITDDLRILMGYEATKNTFSSRYVNGSYYCHIDKGSNVEVVGCSHPKWAGWKGIGFSSSFCSPIGAANAAEKEDEENCPSFGDIYDMYGFVWENKEGIRTQDDTFVGKYRDREGVYQADRKAGSKIVCGYGGTGVMPVEYTVKSIRVWVYPGGVFGEQTTDSNVIGCEFEGRGFSGVRWDVGFTYIIYKVELYDNIGRKVATLTKGGDTQGVINPAAELFLGYKTPVSSTSTFSARSLRWEGGNTWVEFTSTSVVEVDWSEYADGQEEYFAMLADVYETMGNSVFEATALTDAYVYRTLSKYEGGKETQYWFPYYDGFYEKFSLPPDGFFSSLGGGLVFENAEELLNNTDWENIRGGNTVFFDYARYWEEFKGDSSGMLSVKLYPSASGEGSALVPAKAAGDGIKDAVESAKEAAEAAADALLDTTDENTTRLSDQLGELEATISTEREAQSGVIQGQVGALHTVATAQANTATNAALQAHNDAENARVQRDYQTSLLSQMLAKDVVIQVNTAETTAAVNLGNVTASQQLSAQNQGNIRLQTLEYYAQQEAAASQQDAARSAGAAADMAAIKEALVGGTAPALGEFPEGTPDGLADNIGGMFDAMGMASEDGGYSPGVDELSGLADSIEAGAAGPDSDFWKVPVPMPNLAFFNGSKNGGNLPWTLQEFSFYNESLLWVLGVFRSIMGVLVSVRFALACWGLMQFAMTQGAASKGE
jgi:hypothetical protein